MRACIAIVGLALILPAARGQFTFEQGLVLHDLFWNNPTSTKIDDQGAIHMAYMKEFDIDDSSKEIWYATNKTGEWVHTQITHNSVREEFPNLELDDQGNVHIAFHTGVAPSNQIRYVNNIGGSFNPIIEITGGGFVIVEHDIDSTGKVHFTFSTQTSGNEDVYYRNWSPTEGLGPLTNVTNSPGDESEPYLTVGPDDTIHLVYHQGDVLFGGVLVYQRSTDGGATFNPVVTGLAASIQTPIPLVAPDGAVTIIFESSNTLSLIQDGGTGVFGRPLPLFSGGNPAFIEGAAVDFAGRRHIPLVSNSGTEGVFLVSETNDGFTAPISIDSADEIRVGASVAVNRWGRLAMTYQFGAVDPNADVVFADIFLAETPTLGDLDQDGQITVADVPLLDACMGGPDTPALCDASSAARADAEGDGDADMADFSRIQGAINRP